MSQKIKKWAWWRVFDDDTVEVHFGWNESYASGVCTSSDGQKITGQRKGVYIWMGVVNNGTGWEIFTNQELYNAA